jgi:hypothetical protein
MLRTVTREETRTTSQVMTRMKKCGTQVITKMKSLPSSQVPSCVVAEAGAYYSFLLAVSATIESQGVSTTMPCAMIFGLAATLQNIYLKMQARKRIATVPNYMMSATVSTMLAVIAINANKEEIPVTMFLALQGCLLSTCLVVNQYGVQNAKSLLTSAGNVMYSAFNHLTGSLTNLFGRAQPREEQVNQVLAPAMNN